MLEASRPKTNSQTTHFYFQDFFNFAILFENTGRVMQVKKEGS
jgi:hypothetical protein